ncbi:STAS domain-containing protein [Melaminivora jejuensis]|uniref:STAS domain-containing protein n=1 Tax=Melaminivora jejuensis TaxID=1267217 RepID=UPI001ADF6126|nr:STAS domain-containing protein [Melaminivora jejuensis]UHJ64329.1 STAS domain-containing protein [Melaminivora jejuensis]
MLTLPAELTFTQARACAQQLVQALRQSGLPGQEGAPHVVLDASALQVFDSSALAVLLECRRAALAQGRALTVQAMPEGLHNLAELYGVQELLTRR